MTDELREQISKMPIHTYLLPGNKTIIGQLVETHEDKIDVLGAFTIEEFYYDNEDRPAKVLEPILPLTLNQKSSISKSHIIIDTPAGFELKNIYCKTMLKYQVLDAIQNNMNTSFDLETFDKNRDYSDRWNF